MKTNEIAGYENLSKTRQNIVKRLLENLDKGYVYSSTWTSGVPESGITGKKYRGANYVTLALESMVEGYTDNRWVTYRQMSDRGWKFKTDEKGNNRGRGRGVPIEYFELRDKITKQPFNRALLDGMSAEEIQRYIDENVYPVRRSYIVFNGELIDGIEKTESEISDKNLRIDAAENILNYWNENESKIVYGGNSAYYSVLRDEIHLPLRNKFKSQQAFYATALHEIGHSTGNEKRLDRPLKFKFENEEYAKEELRAEIASMFMEADLNIEPSEKHIQNTAAYIEEWKAEIEKDPNALFAAISDADKIAKYVIGKAKAYAAENISADYFETETYDSANEEAEAKTEETIEPAAETTAAKATAEMLRMSDREIFERAKSLKSGDNFEKLYNGENLLKNVEKSERSLMRRLAIYCGNDEEQVYRIFKTSKLFDDTKPNSYYKKMATEAIEFAKELLPEKSDASEMPANVQKSVSAIQKNEHKSVFAIQK